MSKLEDILTVTENICNQATPGPWKTLNKGHFIYVGNWNDPHDQKEIYVESEDTAMFIAHARSALPKCLEVIRKLRKQKEKWKDRARAWTDDEHEDHDDAELVKILEGVE